MGIDRGGMCDTGESLDSFLERANAVQKERDRRYEEEMKKHSKKPKRKKSNALSSRKM